MFRTNPKQLVERIARNLYGLSHRVRVTGARPSPEECALKGYKRGNYVTCVFIDGAQVAQADDYNWRKSYTKLIDVLKEAHKLSVKPVQTSTGV